MSRTLELPINTWEQVGHGGVFVTRYQTMGRNPSFAGWQVVRVGFDINQRPKEKRAWYENGTEKFSTYGDGPDRGKASLARAKAWAGERYRITKWHRNAVGDYVDADKNYPPLRPR